MALTPEQIKNLKKGDPLIIHGTFESVDGDGDICIKSPMTFCGHPYHNNIKYAHPSVVSIDNPKHDPCRPFREGDVVRFMRVNGNNARCRYNGVEIKEGSLGRIVKKEGRNCFWVEFDVHHNWCLDAAYFELVTPVEELEPYHILHNIANGYVVYKDKPKTDNIVVVFNNTHPNAKEAAEAECARLNAEWRKEQK